METCFSVGVLTTPKRRLQVYVISKTMEGNLFVLLSDKPEKKKVLPEPKLVAKNVGNFKLDEFTKERLRNFKKLSFNTEEKHVQGWRNKRSNRRPVA
jgi:hypothetical protein